MLPDEKRKCHLTGFKTSCLKLVSSKACDAWKHIHGENPMTGETVDKWGCERDMAVPMLMHLSVKLQELKDSTIGVQAAVESERNEIVRAFNNSLVFHVEKHEKPALLEAEKV